MNIEYILMMSIYTLRSIVAFKSENSIKMALSRKIVRDVMVMGFTTPLQSVPITTNVVSSNPVHGEVYSKQHYVLKFVSDLRQVGGFLRPPVSSTNKADRHDITEILLKVAFNTINQPFVYFSYCFFPFFVLFFVLSVLLTFFSNCFKFLFFNILKNFN